MHLDDHVIRSPEDIPWDRAPDWVGWWVAESWGGSWLWQNEPQLVDSYKSSGPHWLAKSGYTPVFAGWAQGMDWESSKTKRPERLEGVLGPPPEVKDAAQD